MAAAMSATQGASYEARTGKDASLLDEAFRNERRR
jgi:hypothetical protein